MKTKLKTRMRLKRNKTRKMKGSKKIKGGNNPFSDIFGMWGTMTYNLSNALSVFSVDAPTAYMKKPNRDDPSPGKQFI
jgi:hypothetical protein